jgi:hypothetical protein
MCVSEPLGHERFDRSRQQLLSPMPEEPFGLCVEAPTRSPTASRIAEMVSDTSIRTPDLVWRTVS